MSPCVNVFALAGPMEQAAAHSFRKKWKTPPRLLNSSRTKLPEDPPFFKNVMSTHSLRKILNDPEKGLERIGRELAHQYEIGWKEYWPFLNTFTDLNSTDGLDLLEKHIEKKYQSALKTWEEQNKTIAFGKILAGPQYIITGNYENNNKPVKSPTKILSPTQIISPMSDLCKVFENCCKINDNSYTENGNFESNYTDYEPVNPSSNPFLCVTKSLQVFGTRIYYIIRKLSKIRDEDLDQECLKIEIRHLISLIASYKSDNGFSAIPFENVHLRVADIISEKICEEFFDRRTELEKFAGFLNCLNTNGFIASILNQHINCILKYIKNYVKNFLNDGCGLKDKRGTLTEEDCRKLWSLGGETCTCSWVLGKSPSLQPKKKAEKVIS